MVHGDIPSFPLTTTMVKSNIQNKSSATNACPPGPQATSTSVGESSDSLNLISRASSRAGKRVHPRGRSRARCTVRHSSRSVSAAEDSRKASPEPSSSSAEEKSEEEEVSPGPRTPTASRIITGKLSHGPNHGTAELSSKIKGGSAVADTCDVTGDCDILVTCDSLPQVLQPVTSNIVTSDVTHDCDLWDGEHHVTSLSGHFGYLENDAKVLASSVLHIARFIQKHPIRSCPIEQFPPILGAGSIMWHLFQTMSAAGWDRFKVSLQPDSPSLVEAMRTLFMVLIYPRSHL